MMNAERIFDPEEATKHMFGNGVDKMSFEQLHWFKTVTQGMAEIAEKEIQRRNLPYHRVPR